MKLNIPNGILCLLIFSITLGCKEEGEISHENLSGNNELNANLVAENTLTLPIDVTKSKIAWRGTKLGGIRGHQGILNFEDGYLLLNKDSIVGGYFIANMKSLEVTDIPDDQAKAKNNLKNHLKSEFNTELYPQATFEITNVKYSDPTDFQVLGKLKIRGIENSIYAPFTLVETTGSNKLMTTKIKLDRSDWNIGEEGSWLEKRVVDDSFHLEITIVF